MAKFDLNSTGNALLTHVLGKRGAGGIVSVYRPGEREWVATLINEAGETIREVRDPDYLTALESVLGEITEQDMEGFEQES